MRLPSNLNGIPVEWRPAPSAGRFLGGPFKIVHHTTEGPSLEGAISTLGAKHAQSHFVIDSHKIVQLIDTDEASKSLQNLAGGVETNRDSAIQMEIVGHANEQPKDRTTLAHVAMVCRALEDYYHIPRVWPNGYPRMALPGKGDPGGHNRNAEVWNTKSGHYTHGEVPENLHYDTGYSREDADFVVPPGVVIHPPPVMVSVMGIPADPTLNLRALPAGKIIEVLTKGTLLEVLDRQGKWLKVSTPTEVTGWVWSAYTVEK